MGDRKIDPTLQPTADQKRAPTASVLSALAVILVVCNVALMWLMTWRYHQLNAAWGIWNFRQVAEQSLEEP